MKISYDKEVDALNIVFKKGRVARTVEAAPEVFVDLDGRGNPLYVEIIGATEKLGKNSFRNINIGKKVIHLPTTSNQ